MKYNTRNWTVFDTIILVLSFVQFSLLILNSIAYSDRINLFAFWNNYVLIALIIVALIKRGWIKHFLAIIFFICFFIFLMGQKIFKEEKNVFLTFVRTELDSKQFCTFLMILFLGIAVTYFSYLLSCDKHVNNRDAHAESVRLRNNHPILPLIRLLFLITLPCAAYMQFKIVMVRSSMSYTSSYLINVDIPTLIKIGYYLFTCFTMIYLALKPSKKEVYFVLAIMLIIEGGVQLLQGRRALFATTLFFVIWYLIKYYKIKKINMKYVIGFIIGGIALIILFFFVEMQRSGINVSNVSLIYIVRRFMISTGGSDSVIGNTIAHADLFPKSGIWYLIDPIINNPIFVILTGKGGISQGTAYLQNFNSFSHWISYLIEPSLYSSGHGMGSCYLAEVYLAFRMPGVFLVSIIIGKVIKFISDINFQKSVFRTSLAFVLVQNLFTLPRGGLFSWVGDVTYMLVGFCIVYPFYQHYCRSRIGVQGKDES